jgi:negative regulator of flagellin synthesis FlgM
MKVTERQPLPITGQVANDKGEQGAEAARKQQPANKGQVAPKEDRVVLSANERVDRVHASLEKVPDIRMDKVNEIRAKIDAGTYKVPGSDVAEKIIDTLQSSREK